MNHLQSPKRSHWLWDLFCLASVVGIWPRFVEPNLILTTRFPVKIAHLPQELIGFKILQISDLHFSGKRAACFFEKVSHKAAELSPDLIVLTGDFLNYSKCDDPEALKRFLSSLKAPQGSYAIFGNHDYSQTVTVNSQGDYDVVNLSTTVFSKAFKRIFGNIKVTGKRTPAVDAVGINEPLLDLLQQASVHVLHNETVQIPVGKAMLNLCGLGEYTLGQCKPEEAFKGYDTRFPGIVLAHNPDSAALLQDYPGEMILSGHTHGGQINLPWIWRRLTLMEDMRFKSGRVQAGKKQIYISRGLGSVLPFRCFTPPELVLVTLEDAL